MGVVRIGWVWLERCRDGSYAVNALHCDVCSLCMPSGVHCCLFHWFLGQCFWVEVHPYMTGFLHFLAKCFFCNLFWGILGGGNKCVGVNAHGVGKELV